MAKDTRERDVMDFRASARQLVGEVGEITAGSANEQNLRYGIEGALERKCSVLAIPWTPYQLDRAVRDEEGGIGFVDVVHGAIIIEYEPPHCFNEGRSAARVQHAKDQAVDYAVCMAREEGRPVGEYILIVWDGIHIAFGDIPDGKARWERLQPFDQGSAERLLRLLHEQGRPLVHPAILRQLIGPNSNIGAELIPALFRAIRVAIPTKGRTQTKTTLLYKEWRRLFGQAVGIQTEKLAAYLATQSRQHAECYCEDIPAYLFALHTYIAVVAKIVAAMALPNVARDVGDPTTPLQQRIQALESGRLFADAGITNMLTGDFFSWYADDASWQAMEAPFRNLIVSLSGVSFDLARKQPDSVRDLFKGIYEVFVPRELRRKHTV